MTQMPIAKMARFERIGVEFFWLSIISCLESSQVIFA